MLKNGTSQKEAEDVSKSARTRERILNSAAYVLSRKGYAATRLADVAEHAELQAPAIYYYFKSREELIEEVMYTGIAHMRANLLKALDALPPETSPMDRILVAVEESLRFELTISDYTTASTRNAGQLPEHLRVRHDKERSGYGKIWRGLFADASEAGELNPDLDLRAARMLVIGAVSWAVEWWNPKSGSLSTVVRTAQTIVKNGLANYAEIPSVPAKKRAAATRSRRTKTAAS
ncbi:TetR/AcrR family transcriptional regulator [Rhodococcus aetherivorans]|uniref:TetR/AcrR family transcriptional regulator n=1 Tax=Rhodococcus aetherivorans TaxID=191292 RepID=UPI0002D21B79|nr:TetR/AcrR family transcriptional regulator [Rhodococcus aetherivorans]CCW13688.1 Transcriptional regulator, TetR family [Rhodococcus aetherivorans]